MDELTKSLTTRELQAFLKQKNLSYYYRLKTDLVDRIRGTFDNITESEIREVIGKGKDFDLEKDEEKIPETDREEEEENEEEDIEDRMPNESTNNFVFRDVEDSLEHFSGEAGKNLTVWLKDFEDIATVCQWNDIQKFLYTKRLLRGAARLAVEARTGLSSYAALKNVLETEFQKTKTTIEVHRALEARKKKTTESLLEYLYSMQQLANEGKIDEESLVEYIRNGIPDSIHNKMILYEATSLEDLKKKMESYRQMKKFMPTQQGFNKNGSNTSKPSTTIVKGGQTGQSLQAKRCHNCGSKSHLGASCPDKGKGTRCFKCNQFGHISPDCPVKNETPSTSRGISHVHRIESDERHIPISVETYYAFVDNGSDVSIITKSFQEKISAAEPRLPGMMLKGFGDSPRKTLGSCVLEIQIGAEKYANRFQVVPDRIPDQILLGRDFLRNVEIVISGGKIKVVKSIEEGKSIKEEYNLEENDIFQIERCPEKDSEAKWKVGNEEYRKAVNEIVDAYRPNRLAKSCIEMNIVLTDDIPVFRKARRLAIPERDAVNKQVKEWLDEGVVVPSRSEYASPIVLVKKKDGKYRLCIDYRELNKKMIKDRFPMTVMEEVFEPLHDANVFITLDLKDGFFHVDVEKSSRRYTAFVTPDGQYEFLKVPFGLCNSPAAFQRFINQIFRDLVLQKYLLVYVDDIIIFAKSEDEALEKLKMVLRVAEEYGLKIKWEKCNFLSRSVEFLGHVIGNGSIKPSEEKV
ncbi:uncharacterized protein LOC129953572 [Eupeodes corollae]|uniref:uncharacterized protein LOC129953572 n=1 Tax=Eupeodes corollae TaxID=290404 RepID=UPI0024931D7B|nr:uncharacterized protein LOC129953572 [Eupeodes corollae]